MKGGEKVLKMLEACTLQSEKLLNIQKDITAMRGSEVAKNLYTLALPESNQILTKIAKDFNDLELYDLKLKYNQNELLHIKE